MNDHLVAIVVLVLTVVLVVLAIPPAAESILRLLRAWREGKTMSSEIATGKRPSTWVFNVAAAVLLALVAWKMWSEGPSGFNKDWPDALKCNAELVSTTNSADYSPLIFYFNGVRNSQTLGSRVYGYFLAGGYNYPKVGYLVHEIWFRDSGLLVRPKDFGFAEPGFYSIDPEYKRQMVQDKFPNDGIFQHYMLGFNNADCGGNTIQQIKQSGNAFTLARKL